MIITKDFVFLHFPKTAGLFVSRTLRKLYKRQEQNQSWFRKLTSGKRPNYQLYKTEFPFIGMTRHNGIREVPDFAQKLPILACLRNPLDYYVSLYCYNAWKNKPFYDPSVIRETFEHWPDLSFGKFLEFNSSFKVRQLCESFGYPQIKGVGYFTYFLLHFYFKHPKEILQGFDHYLDRPQDLLQELGNIHFIRQEALCPDLIDFLSRFDFSDEQLAFIKEEEKVNVAKSRKKRSWESFYSQDDLARVQSEDTLSIQLVESIYGQFS